MPRADRDAGCAGGAVAGAGRADAAAPGVAARETAASGAIADAAAAARACTRCGACRAGCAFLRAHDLVIGDVERLRELAYHCFLCGRCARVCPEGIDGRAVVLGLRRELVARAGGRAPGRGYAATVAEKRRYPFANYRRAARTSVFPGCNLPGALPRTTARLVDVLAERAGAGVVYDCCGKPLADLGLENEARRVLRDLGRRLSDAGVARVATACPNCFHYLRGRIPQEVVSVYRLLEEAGVGVRAGDGHAALGVGEQAGGAGLDLPDSAEGASRVAEDARSGQARAAAPSAAVRPVLFPPCPDRATGELLADLAPFAPAGGWAVAGDAPGEPQCCGLGGCAGVREPVLARAMGEQAGALAPAADEPVRAPGAAQPAALGVRVYCASCAGAIARAGHPEVRHVLSDILGVDEAPDTACSLVNRARTKFA